MSKSTALDVEAVMARTAYWTGATFAFLAELASLAALAAAGWAVPGSTLLRGSAAIALPLVAAVLWGLFAAPRAVLPHPVGATLTKVLVQGGAAAALVVLAHPLAAAALAAAVVLGAALTARSAAGLSPAR